MGPKLEDNFIMTCATAEIRSLKVDKGTCVFEVDFDGLERGLIMLDSGGRISRFLRGDVPMLPRDLPVENHGGHQEPHRQLGDDDRQVQDGAPSGFQRAGAGGRWEEAGVCAVRPTRETAKGRAPADLRAGPAGAIKGRAGRALLDAAPLLGLLPALHR